MIYIYLINQARGLYWENIGPRSWQYGLSAARSVHKRARADILSVQSRARLVNKRFITRLKKAKTCKNTSAGSFGTKPGPILREYWTGNRAVWLVDFSYWPSDCLSRVIIHCISFFTILHNRVITMLQRCWASSLVVWGLQRDSGKWGWKTTHSLDCRRLICPLKMWHSSNLVPSLDTGLLGNLLMICVILINP